MPCLRQLVINVKCFEIFGCRLRPYGHYSIHDKLFHSSSHQFIFTSVVWNHSDKKMHQTCKNTINSMIHFKNIKIVMAEPYTCCHPCMAAHVGSLCMQLTANSGTVTSKAALTHTVQEHSCKTFRKCTDAPPAHPVAVTATRGICSLH